MTSSATVLVSTVLLLHNRSASASYALQVVMEVSGDSSVTAVDVADHPVVGGLAAGRGELTGLALWLMAERCQVGPSPCDAGWSDVAACASVGRGSFVAEALIITEPLCYVYACSAPSGWQRVDEACCIPASAPIRFRRCRC